MPLVLVLGISGVKGPVGGQDSGDLPGFRGITPLESGSEHLPQSASCLQGDSMV